MAKINKFYKCEVCGNVVSVIAAGEGNLVCCGKPMVLMQEHRKEDEGKEKHVPVIEKTKAGVRVKVGSVPHPMEEKHYIQLIQLIENDNVIIGKRLKPGDEPTAEFCIVPTEKMRARILCNIHGLWIS
jgi:superoxide reductase